MLAFINSRSVWLDEATSVWIASQPYKSMTHILQHVDAVHALYYSLLHVWMHLGTSAIVVRLLSVVFAIITCLLMSRVAMLMFDGGAALGVVAVLATSPFLLFYADEARSVTFSLMMCSLAALGFWQVVRKQRVRDVAVFGVFSVVAIYANVLDALFIAGLATSLAFIRLNRRTTMLLVGTGVIACIAIAPLLFLIHANSLAQIDWIPRSKPMAIVHIARGIIGDTVGTGGVSRACGILGSALVFVLMAVGIVGGWRSRETRASVVAASTWFLIPLALAVAVNQFVQPIFILRYFSFTLIPVALLAGNGLLTIRRGPWPIVAFAAAAVLGACSIQGLLAVQREDWRSVSRFLLHNSRAGDGIVLYGPQIVMPFEFAVHESGSAESASVVYPNGPLVNAVAYPKPRRGFVRMVSHRFKRVWLIESHDLTPPGHTEPFKALSRLYGHSSQKSFVGIRVFMYARSP